jgi:hypothetical protein
MSHSRESHLMTSLHKEQKARIFSSREIGCLKIRNVIKMQS